MIYLSAQLLAIWFCDYVLENVTKTEAVTCDPETQDEDIKQFIFGEMMRMKRHSLFGEAGLERMSRLRKASIESVANYGNPMPPIVYERIFGKWFLDEIGAEVSDESTSEFVGGVLRMKAKYLFLS